MEGLKYVNYWVKKANYTPCCVAQSFFADNSDKNKKIINSNQRYLSSCSCGCSVSQSSCEMTPASCETISTVSCETTSTSCNISTSCSTGSCGGGSCGCGY